MSLGIYASDAVPNPFRTPSARLPGQRSRPMLGVFTAPTPPRPPVLPASGHPEEDLGGAQLAGEVEVPLARGGSGARLSPSIPPRFDLVSTAQGAPRRTRSQAAPVVACLGVNPPPPRRRDLRARARDRTFCFPEARHTMVDCDEVKGRTATPRRRGGCHVRNEHPQSDQTVRSLAEGGQVSTGHAASTGGAHHGLFVGWTASPWTHVDRV